MACFRKQTTSLLHFFPGGSFDTDALMVAILGNLQLVAHSLPFSFLTSNLCFPGSLMHGVLAGPVDQAAADRITRSSLYFDVPPNKQPILYTSSYDITFFGLEKM